MKNSRASHVSAVSLPAPPRCSDTARSVARILTFTAATLWLPLGLCGCVAYQGERVPNLVATGAKPTLMQSPEIEIVLTHRHTFDGDDTGSGTTGATYDLARASFERVRKETPFLARAGSGLAEPRYVLELETEVAEHGRTSAIITGATLLLFPGFTSSDVIVRGRLKNADGALISDHEAKGELKLIMHLILFPVTPFALATINSDRLYDDTFRDVVIQIGRDLERYHAGHAS